MRLQPFSLSMTAVPVQMLDRLLLNERMPEELAAKTQMVSCNDCGARSTVPYHFVYHKCLSCSSYNTRVL